MSSKWASAPSTSSYGYNNRSRYDNNNDRYGNRSRYNNSDRPTGGRLNRSVFEDDTNKENDSFERRNHYDKESDRDTRNGGFDNIDNFKYRKQPAEVHEAEAEAIKSWNAYKPPADENKIKPIAAPAQPAPAPAPTITKPQEEKKKDDKLPLDEIANFKPASFSWADDIDNSSDDDDFFDRIAIKSVEDESLSNVDIATPEPALNDAPEPIAKDDDTPAPEPIEKDDDTPAPEPIAKDECFKVNESMEEKPLPPVYNWGSLEEPEVVTKSEPEAQPAVEPPAVETTIDDNADIENKPLPTYSWGSLEEYKPVVTATEPAAVVVDEESALLAWKTLGESAVEIEEKPLPVTPPTEVEVVATESDADWNKNVAWNTESQPQPEESWNNGTAVEEQPQQHWSNAAVAEEQPRQWSNDAVIEGQPQQQWNSMDFAAPAAEAKPVIKDSWKNKLAPTEQDNASAWKSFAETTAIPAPTPPTVKKEEPKIDISAPQSWDTVQNPTDWNSSQQQQQQPLVQQEEAKVPDPQEQPKAPIQQEVPTSSWSSFAEAESNPKEVLFKLSDFSAPTNNVTTETASKPVNQAPVTASFKLSDFTAASTSSPPPPTTSSPRIVSLKLSDFGNSAPSTTTTTTTASFKLSDFEGNSPSLQLGNNNSTNNSNQPHTVSLKLGDFASSTPVTTDTTNMLSLRLSDFNMPTHSFKLSDFNQPQQTIVDPPAQAPSPAQHQQSNEDWKANTSWSAEPAEAASSTQSQQTSHSEDWKANNSWSAEPAEVAPPATSRKLRPVNPPTPTITERHPEQWGQVSNQINHHINSNIVESTERPRRKLQMAGGQWNALQKNLTGRK
ncbi:unnamed protein product [Mucor hiemalis]